MLKRPCIRCGTPSAHNPCPSCAKLMRPAFPSHKRSRQQRGYNAEYDRNRDAVIQHVILHGGVCFLCGRAFAHDQKITAEHIVPLRKGGGNDLGNLAPAHLSCNSSGGARARHGRRRPQNAR